MCTKKCWRLFFYFHNQFRNIFIFDNTFKFKHIKNCSFWTEFENTLCSKNHRKKMRYKMKIPSPTNLQYDIQVNKFGNKNLGAGPLWPVKIFKVVGFSKNCTFLDAYYYSLV